MTCQSQVLQPAGERPRLHSRPRRQLRRLSTQVYANFTCSLRTSVKRGATRRAVDKKATPRPAVEATEVPLPAERAFVVQLRDQRDPSPHLFAGRVEHIAPGARCVSAQPTSCSFIAKVLGAGSSDADRSSPTAKGGRTT